MTQGSRGWWLRMSTAGLGLVFGFGLVGCTGTPKPLNTTFPASLPAPQLEPTPTKPKTGESSRRSPLAGQPSKNTPPVVDPTSMMPTGTPASSTLPSLGTPVVPTTGGTLPLQTPGMSNGYPNTSPITMPGVDPVGGLKNPMPPEPPSMPVIPPSGAGTGLPIGGSIPSPQMPPLPSSSSPIIPPSLPNTK